MAEQELSLDARPTDPKGVPNGNNVNSHGNADEDVAQVEDSGDRGVIVTDEADLPAMKSKKKKKRKPASKRGVGKPTGMEEFFADSPLTPDEYEEQKTLYDPAISFLDRLLTAIQRFERTRRLTPERRDIFYKWLHYGSIVVGSSVGTGNQNQEQMDKDDVAVALSQVQISKELRDGLSSAETEDPTYVVDWLGCMHGFLSHMAPTLFVFDTKEDVDRVTSTLERFMDYLMQHDVCSEYSDEILATRGFCREAATEMWACAEAQKRLPGEVNLACSRLFGSSSYQNLDGETTWHEEALPGELNVDRLTRQKASDILRFAVMGAASEEVYEKYCHLNGGVAAEKGIEVIRIIEDHGFEVIHVEAPTADCKDAYKQFGSEDDGSDKFRPVGKVIGKQWNNPAAPAEDLTESEKEASGPELVGEEYIFFVEEIVLQHLSVGQKIMATIQQLNCGIWFFDGFTRILPNFELWMENELMEDYKEPRWLKDAYVPGADNWAGPGGQDDVNARIDIEAVG